MCRFPPGYSPPFVCHIVTTEINMKRRAVVLVACSVLLMYVVIYSYSYNPDRYFDDIMSKFGADYRHYPPGLSGSVMRCGSYRRLRVQDRRLAARDKAGSVERPRHPQQCSVQLGVGRDSERSPSRQRWPPHHWVPPWGQSVTVNFQAVTL